MGAIRGICQLISYEISVTLVILPLILCGGSLNYTYFIFNQMTGVWYFLPFLPLMFCFLIGALAETNRIPFDLIEAEAELVAGYNVEYGGFLFALFFLSEYSAILLISSLFSIFFFGGGDFVLLINAADCNSFFNLCIYDFAYSFKVMLLSFIFIFIRANLPRYRFDQLLYIG
jgi:NADH-quinone oxidoreductase subunit H